jgi:peptide deformylase
VFKKVVLEGSSILRTKCPALSLDKIKETLATNWSLDEGEYTLDQLLRDMHQTMIAENGIGLAANQIGWKLRLFILRNKTSTGYDEYINPEVISQDELVDFENEGCLSIPGVVANTKRFRKVKLQWQDRQGTLLEGNFEDMDAFAVQHEMDHLNGKLYIDQLGPVKRSMVLRKHKKFVRERGG